jgi:hypothetical protein
VPGEWEQLQGMIGHCVGGVHFEGPVETFKVNGKDVDGVGFMTRRKKDCKCQMYDYYLELTYSYSFQLTPSMLKRTRRDRSTWSSKPFL